ncbi:MAG TPA: YibE/F family protein, partial [Actinotalea sp.]|nr:YibE/F family protein [Actinotalea sp.]
MRWDRTTVVLAAILLPLVLATAVGLVLLWPTGTPRHGGIVETGADYPIAWVVGVDAQECAGANEDRLPDGSIPEAVPCLLVDAELATGDVV